MVLTRLPILLNKDDTEKARLNASSLSLELNEVPVSTATLELPDSEPDVLIGDNVHLFSPMEDVGIFIVSSVKVDCSDRTRSISLEHGFAILDNRVVFGAVTCADITGDEEAKEVKIKVAIDYLLEHYQTEWQLGQCDFADETLAISFDGCSILQALKDISEAIGECYFTFDQSTKPWTFNMLRKNKDEEPTCEMRLSRNIESALITYDRTDMYTRIYPIGGKTSGETVTIKNVNNDVEYLEKNVDVWGLHEHIETESGVVDEDLLLERAQEKLDAHCEPIISVEISGLDYVLVTGEAFDDIRLGKTCRLPIPERKVTITERIISLKWSDALNDPERVSVTLANKDSSMSSIAGATITQRSRDEYKYVRDTGRLYAWANDPLFGDGRDTLIRQTPEMISMRATQRINGEFAEGSIVVSADGIMLSDIIGTYHKDKDGNIVLDESSQGSFINVNKNKVVIKGETIQLDGFVQAVQGIFAGRETAEAISTNTLTVGGQAAVGGLRINGKLVAIKTVNGVDVYGPVG